MTSKSMGSDAIAQILICDAQHLSPFALFGKKLVAQYRLGRTGKTSDKRILEIRDGGVEQTNKGDNKASESG